MFFLMVSRLFVASSAHVRSTPRACVTRVTTKNKFGALPKVIPFVWLSRSVCGEHVHIKWYPVWKLFQQPGHGFARPLSGRNSKAPPLINLGGLGYVRKQWCNSSKFSPATGCLLIFLCARLLEKCSKTAKDGDRCNFWKFSTLSTPPPQVEILTKKW